MCGEHCLRHGAARHVKLTKGKAAAAKFCGHSVRKVNYHVTKRYTQGNTDRADAAESDIHDDEDTISLSSTSSGYMTSTELSSSASDLEGDHSDPPASKTKLLPGAKAKSKTAKSKVAERRKAGKSNPVKRRRS